MDHCLAPSARATQYGTDNMTVILIVFLHGKSYEELATKCKKVSEAQEEARRGLSLADILADSDDEEEPPLPPRPAGFTGEPIPPFKDGDKNTLEETPAKEEDMKKGNEDGIKENGEEHPKTENEGSKESKECNQSPEVSS